MDTQLQAQVAEHVQQLFREHITYQLVYHDLKHTQSVADHSVEIGMHYQLDAEDMFVVYAAAWFHDTGHLFHEVKGHEAKSVEIMRAFFKDKDVPAPVVQKIEGCIFATQMPTNPKSLIEEILADADSYHFGTDKFRKTNKMVMQEFVLRGHSALTTDWNKRSLTLLEQHRYYTSYCQELLNDGKLKNIKRLRKKIVKEELEATAGTIMPASAKKDEVQAERKTLLGRGVQTIFRLVSSNHFDLSEMADRKANLLISVNAIIISIMVTVFIRRLDIDDPTLIPVFVLLSCSLITIILSIMATRPKITEGVFNRQDVISRKTNLLFFGNFYKSSLEDYKWAMYTMLKDPEYLYGTLIHDVHQLGIVLGRKYKLIRLAYNVFMVGLLVSVVAFVVTALLSHPDTSASVQVSQDSPF